MKVDSERSPRSLFERAVQERIDRVSTLNFEKNPIYHAIFSHSVEEATETHWSTVIGAPQAVPFDAGAESLSDAAGTPVRTAFISEWTRMKLILINRPSGY